MTGLRNVVYTGRRLRTKAFELSISSEGKVEYLHHDQAGSTRLITGSAGTAEASFTYDGYGNLIGHTGTATTPLGYDAQYTTPDTNLIYLRARTYDPTTAQFLSRDPLAANHRRTVQLRRRRPDGSSRPKRTLRPRLLGRHRTRRTRSSNRRRRGRHWRHPRSRGNTWRNFGCIRCCGR
jgi:RHS repeat-associated protein